MPPVPGLVQAITQAAQARGVDPRAALAVAAQEGLGGGIGDNGTSFGPFQLHQGGAFPGGIPHGTEQQWATSQPGINYALDRIAGVSKGLSGPAAVQAIVSRFERPANPQGEIQRALAAYGSSGGQPVGAPPAPAGVPGGGGDARHAFATALLSAISPTGQLDNNGLVGALQARQNSLPVAAAAHSVQPQTGGAPAGGGNPYPAGAPIGRVDQGVDYSKAFHGPVFAIGNGTVTKVDNHGWGGGGAVYYQLDKPMTINGHTYTHAYTAEAGQYPVQPGQRVQAGQPIAYTKSGWQESGFASPNGGPLAPLVGGLGAGTKPTTPGYDFLTLTGRR